MIPASGIIAEHSGRHPGVGPGPAVARRRDWPTGADRRPTGMPRCHGGACSLLGRYLGVPRDPGRAGYGWTTVTVWPASTLIVRLTTTSLVLGSTSSTTWVPAASRRAYTGVVSTMRPSTTTFR
jgi:hypothetical protein